MIKIAKQIPNLLTLCNLFLGCVAILHIFKGEVTIACLLVFIAGVIDFLDGFVARLLNAQSDIGLQLDSLADVVTFGVVPGLIMYQLLASTYQLKLNAPETSNLYYLPAFLLSCAGAYRLAKFNVTAASQKNYFVGMPIPFMGLFICTIPLIIFFNDAIINAKTQTSISDYILQPWVLYTITLLLSYLMISKYKLINLKPSNFILKDNYTRVALIIIALLAILFLKYMASIVILLAYLILSYIEFNIIQKNINHE